MKLLFDRGLAVSDRLASPDVIGVFGSTAVPLVVVGALLGSEVWYTGGIDGGVEDSPLFLGKGNSSAGGMGRMFVPSISAEERSIVKGSFWTSCTNVKVKRSIPINSLNLQRLWSGAKSSVTTRNGRRVSPLRQRKKENANCGVKHSHLHFLGFRRCIESMGKKEGELPQQ